MIDIPFDRQQLADYLCVERSALSAEISRLSKLGLITLSALFACLGVKRRRLEKGDALMRTGERADRIGILLSGSLSVSAYDLDGRRTIIKRIGPGEIVAAAQALSGADAMSVDVEADGDCDVLLVKTDRILSPCLSTPASSGTSCARSP